MLFRTLLKLEDLEAPFVKMVLPQLHVGSVVTLCFILKRHNKGRDEVLKVQGDWRVTNSSFDFRTHPFQNLSLIAMGVTPVWVAVKKQAIVSRKLGPTKYPPQQIR